MKMMAFKLVLLMFALSVRSEDDLQDFDFDLGKDEIMIAQESRQYQTIVKPPIRIVKPKGITNSHRPQYNIDSEEFSLDDFFEPTTTRKTTAKDYKQSYKLRSKEGMIRDAVLRALERKDHVGKFAQILPIIRAMSGNQRVALASLVASQVSTPPGRTPLNLAQVRSMFGNDANTTNDLMLPILLDLANLIRRAVRSGKEPREAKQPPPQPQMLRRSFTETEDTILDDEPFQIGNDKIDIATTKAPQTTQRNVIRNRRIRPQSANVHTKTNKPTTTTLKNDVWNAQQNITKDTNAINDTSEKSNVNSSAMDEGKKNFTFSTTEPSKASTIRSFRPGNASRVVTDNSTNDLAADSTNQTLAQDLPVAEKLRAVSKYIDRNGNLIQRGSYPPKQSPATRRTTAEPMLSPIRRRPLPARKLPTSAEQAKCELFTNTLCLHAEDYPTDAIMQSIRRNKAAAGALLADFRDPGEGAVDGVTADQEAKYTAEHYLVSNRRGDTANRDFASAGEAGFMCPSTVKYARPQRARATSGQWKYIVNTGEHTQTLRLEKCLKPKESCTYLTDNFKSKCVQVYNYHRLLTWDQQNGLHMDIFKVPTCCSCHIEGYSVSFPPLGHRTHETSAENFPGEELSSEHGNHAFEAVQSTVQRPSITKNPPFTRNKPLESFPPFTENQNFISGSSFTNAKITDNDELSNIPPSSPMDSYGNTYFPDSFNQASSVRNIKRPISVRNPIGQGVSGFDSATLPSYLEPPTPSAPSSFSFVKEIQNKYKIGQNQFKRGAVRPSRRPERPIRKKISGAPDDLISSGTSAIEAHSNTELETMEDFNDDLEEPEVTKINANLNLSKRVTIAPQLHAAATDHNPTTIKPQEQSKTVNDNIGFNGKRVNYNYHPIIDFFEEVNKEEDSSIDREDNLPAYIPTLETEWKPINHPPPRTIQATNLVGKKKHK